jgi:hypothetical protein
MAAHKFAPGNLVQFQRGFLQPRTAPGVYTVVRALPAGLTACNIRCKASGSRTDVLPQSINSFRLHPHTTRERRSMPFPELH